MPSTTVKVSNEFFKAQRKSIIWIVIFFLTMIFSCILSLAILGLCLYLAFHIVAAKIMIWTILGAFGLAAMGGLIVYFNWKFIFGIFKPYDEIGYEIKENDYPELFELIYKTAEEVGTQKPKKVFLIEEINASVYYSNQLRSLVLPTRKNLNIGVGLLNSTSVDEFRGILAHEFGHFSQKSMTVGSHVGTINRILYDILYNKDHVDEMSDDLAHFNQLVALISKGAVLYTKLIEVILKVIYKNLDLNYKALSREMEYHADEIATQIVGKETYAIPLIRLDLVDNCYNQVKEFYSIHRDEMIFTKNMYQNFRQLVTYEVKNQNFEQKNGLPILALDEYNNDKNRIEIEDIWSTHPDMKQRIEKIEKINVSSEKDQYRRATTLIPNIEEFEIKFTEDYFIGSDVIRKNEIDDDDFILKYQNDSQVYRYPIEFNHFFQNNDFDFEMILDESIPNSSEHIDMTSLFSKENLIVKNRLDAIKTEINTLTYLTNQTEIKQFKFENRIFQVKQDGEKIYNQLVKEHDELVNNYLPFQTKVIQYFKQELNEVNHPLLIDLINFKNNVDENIEFINTIRTNLDWAYQVVHEKIRKEGLNDLYEKNEILKSKLNEIIIHPEILKFSNEDDISNIKLYIENEQIFYLEGFNIDTFNQLFYCLDILEAAGNALLFNLTNTYLKSNIKELTYH